MCNLIYVEKNKHCWWAQIWLAKEYDGSHVSGEQPKSQNTHTPIQCDWNTLLFTNAIECVYLINNFQI